MFGYCDAADLVGVVSLSLFLVLFWFEFRFGFATFLASFLVALRLS